MPTYSDKWADEILDAIFADKSRNWRPAWWRKNPEYWGPSGWHPNHSPKGGWGNKPPVEHLFEEPRLRGYPKVAAPANAEGLAS